MPSSPTPFSLNRTLSSSSDSKGSALASTSTVRPAVMPTSSRTTSRSFKWARLIEQLAELEKQLGGQDPAPIVKTHISLLHEYNEVKDSTQALIGQLALLTGQTVTAIHEELELDLME